MNVIKYVILFTYITCYAQTKYNDVYFKLEKINNSYIISPEKQIFEKGDNIHLMDKNKYKLYKNKRKLLKNNYYHSPESGEDNTNIKIPTFSFEVLKIDTINHCDTHFINLVNYKWIQDNTWKENNPNVLFKDLYFLIKINKDKYLKYKVRRTIIAR